MIKVPRPVRPSYKNEFVEKRVVSYMFLPPETPYCNTRCTGCYVFDSGSYRARVQRTDAEILYDIENLTSKGYTVYPTTTEILMMRDYLRILQTVGAKSVLTNGILITEQPEISEQLKSIGIEQIIITGNFENSGLSLTPNKLIERAIDTINASKLGILLRITITPENLEAIPDMVRSCASRGIRIIEFMRYVPLGNSGAVSLNDEQTRRFFSILEQMRKDYPDIYLAPTGTFGTQYRKKQWKCTSGYTYFAIGLDNLVYPCIFLTQAENAIGKYEGGEIIIQRNFEAAGDQYDCPAYSYASRRSGLIPANKLVRNGGVKYD